MTVFLVTFDVAAAAGWKAATGLSAGILEIIDQIAKPETPTGETVTVSFAFTQTDDSGQIIKPAAEVPSVPATRGLPLGSFPAAPRVKGYVFVAWILDGKFFTVNTPVPGDIVLAALWLDQTNPVLPPGIELPEGFQLPTTAVYTVTFNSGLGGAPVAPIQVYAGEYIDEWEVRFPLNTGNTINPKASVIAWLDNGNREYDGRTPIYGNVTLTAKWRIPPYIVNLRMAADGGDIEALDTTPLDDGGYGTVNYNPIIRKSIIDDEWVIVNENTYDVPYNPNRWRKLYRIGFKMPDDFNVGFYTRYTIRARFYANRQGAKTWPSDPMYNEYAFIPNKPADAAGYSQAGLLHGVNSRSDDGWGQISWTSVANWNGEGADPGTMLQRYNLDRKGGTINDAWGPLRGKELAYPPYLLIQTSDAYIGHIEITQIVFHNGEKKYTMYVDEEGYQDAEDGFND